MNIDSITARTGQIWDDSVIPSLMEYIAIPAISPGFDKNWYHSGFLLKAAKLIEQWCRDIGIDNCRIQTIAPEKRTPLLLIEIEPFNTDCSDTVLFYGHIDKQPEFTGWDADKGPWKPVLENYKLYGRGGADDAYSVFTAMTAVKVIQEHNLSHERCVILIESCEESGSLDLDYYLDEYADTIGTPALIVCLDSGCGDFQRLWLTTSLRGGINGVLTVNTLTEGIHSGNSGVIASSFRIIRQLLDRIEDAYTGDILVDELNVDLPEHRLAQIETAAHILGNEIVDAYPLVKGMQPVTRDPVQALINRTWRPTLSYTGAGGIPVPEKAGNVLRPSTSLVLSFRTPPTVDPEAAAARIKSILEQAPPSGAQVVFDTIKFGRGWEMPQLSEDFENIVQQASLDCFCHEPGYIGEGGGIPLMNMLSRRFPAAGFIVTGVLGPHSNAHGPNEFLHIPFVKKLTASIASILAQRCGMEKKEH